MKKILIGGISVFAMAAVNNALAAGYTCEDLIEYTSCNDGLTLSNGQCVESATSCSAGYYLTSPCPDGYIYRTNVCDRRGYSDDVSWGGSEEECLYEDIDGESQSTGYTYHDALCIDADNVYDTYAETINGAQEPTAVTCAAAPAGSYATGGTATSATKCAAGTYQPATGQASCIAAEKGYYVAGTGATAQTACPTTGLTDKDGATVVATTASTGSTGVGACYVGSDVYFANDMGVYHFTSNCVVSGGITDSEGCRFLGSVWDDFSGTCDDIDGSINLKDDIAYVDGVCSAISEYVSLEVTGDGVISWNGTYCECNGSWYYSDQEGIIYCGK